MSIARHISVLAISAGLLAPMPAHAAETANDDKFKNGRPFKELAAEIESNTATIETTEAAAEELEFQLASLSLTVQNLQIAVSDNSFEIARVEGELDAVATQLDAILAAKTEVETALEGLRATDGEATLAVTDLEQQLADLQSQATAQLDIMAAALAAMEADLENEKSELDGLAAYVADVEAAAAVDIGEMRANLAQLALDVDAAETLVSQAQLNKQSIDELEALVSAQAELTASRQALEDLRAEYASHVHVFQDRSDRFETTSQSVYWYTRYETERYTTWCGRHSRRGAYHCHYGYRTYAHPVYHWVTTITALAQYVANVTSAPE